MTIAARRSELLPGLVRRHLFASAALSVMASAFLVAGPAAAQSPTLNILPTPAPVARAAQTGGTAGVRSRAFYPDALIVQFAPGVDPTELINRYINDDAAPRVSSVQVLSRDANIAVVSFADAQRGAATGGINSFIEGDSGVAELPSTRALNALSGRDGVVSVSRDYIVGIDTGDINSIIMDEPDEAGTKDPARAPETKAPATTPAPEQTPKAPEKTPEAKTPASTPEPSLSLGVPRFPNDEGYGRQWHLKLYGNSHSGQTSPGAANFPIVWGQTQGSPDTIIAIVDTGFVASHSDIEFQSRIVPGYDLVSAEAEVADDGTPGPDNDATEPKPEALRAACPGGVDAGWHGSHVAGIAGAASSNNGTGIAGGAWNARIMPVRVLNKCGAARLTDALRGMLWAAGIEVQGLPLNPNPASIINLSLGSTSSTGCNAVANAAINAVHARGVVVVVAAGNDGTDVATRVPAGCRNVITVAASDARGHLTNYSNFGSGIDIMAPGGATDRDDDGDGNPDGVLSTVDGGFMYLQGTSMAAPLVSAAAALLKAQSPGITPDQVRDVLANSARPRSEGECSKACGAGLLDMGGR